MDNTRTVLEIRANWRSIFLLLLIVWFLLSNAYHTAMNPSPGITGIDFQIYYDAANRLAKGEALYVLHPEGATYVYPPPLAMLLQPLARLDYPQAMKLWFFITALCLGGSVLLYSLAARFTWRDLVLAGITIIVGFRFWPSTMNFSLGQVNFILLLIFSAIYLADSRRHLKTVALLIALAALVKTWMLGLLLHLLLRRNWRAAFLGAAAYAALLAGSFYAVGWREWPVFVKLTSGYANQSIGQIAATQSITGFAYLHFSTNNLVEPLTVNPLIAHGFVALGLVLMLAGFLFVWRNPPPQPSYEARLHLGFVMLSLLLTLPMCQSEYFVLCLPLLWTLIAPRPVAGNERRLSFPVVAGSFAVYFLFTRAWPSAPPIPEPYRHGVASLLVSVNFFAALALWLLTLHALRRARVEAPPAKVETPSHVP